MALTLELPTRGEDKSTLVLGAKTTIKSWQLRNRDTEDIRTIKTNISSWNATTYILYRDDHDKQKSIHSVMINALISSPFISTTSIKFARPPDPGLQVHSAARRDLSTVMQKHSSNYLQRIGAVLTEQLSGNQTLVQGGIITWRHTGITPKSQFIAPRL